MNNKDHPYLGVDNIILNEEGKILLAKRSDVAKNFPGMWNLISGHVEWGETIEQALKREAMEEIGCEIEIVRFTGRYYDAHNRHPTKTIVCLPHICKIISGEPKPLDETSEIKWFSPEEIKNMELAYDHKQMLADEGLI